MKKIKNMSIDEARQAFISFSKKHSINDNFDMNYSVINSIKPLLTDNEAIINALYDIFCYGFMAGYKQSEADLKAKVDKRMYSDMQRRLLELVYYLPFGYHAEYFYYLMVYSFEDGMLEAFFPRRIAKPALAIRAEREEKEARKKAEREERQKVIDEALKQYEQQKQ